MGTGRWQQRTQQWGGVTVNRALATSLVRCCPDGGGVQAGGAAEHTMGPGYGAAWACVHFATLAAACHSSPWGPHTFVI